MSWHAPKLKVLLGGAFACALCLSPAMAQDHNPTPSEQYQAILHDYETGASGGGVTSDDERRALIGHLDAKRDSLALRFLQLAESHPDDPIAVDALLKAVWMVNYNPFPTGRGEGPGYRAMSLLLRDHLESEKLGPICLRIAQGFRPEQETFLRSVLSKSPQRSAQGLACLGLAQFLNDRRQRLVRIEADPELAREYEEVFGKDCVDRLLQQPGRAEVVREAESLFERARKDYADVEIPYDGTVGAKATAELFELHHLFVGQVAPDIEGEDQDGQHFKLSDYRGKVIMLDFWHEF